MTRPFNVAEYGAKLATFSKVAAVTMLLVAALAFAAPAQAQTLNFTFETVNATPTTIVPRLTWTTAPAGATCTASASPLVTGWTGTKNSSGMQLLPAISITNDYSLNCTWPGSSTALVSWTAPTTNVDGSALTNLAGYRIQYGRANNEAALDTSVYTATPAVTSWTSPALAAGAWYFGVKAVNAQGLESALSNIATKTITAPGTQARTITVAIRIPNAPTGVQ